MHNICQENVYGHSKRLNWIISELASDWTVMEFGCGTGYMICLPLSKLGFHIHGVDLHQQSVEFGRNLFRDQGLDPNIIAAEDLRDSRIKPHAIIASEVLEHIPNNMLSPILQLIHQRLPPGGRLLVTVPNGYGCFELESFLWYRLGIGKLLEKIKIVYLVRKIKSFLLGSDYQDDTPSTLSASPHVQRFTNQSIQNLLKNHGFKVRVFRGSVLFAGPFTHLIFGGFKSFMRINNFLGDFLPNLASGFFVSCEVE